MHVEPGDPDSAEGAASDGAKSLLLVNAEFGGQAGAAVEAEGRIDAQSDVHSFCRFTEKTDFVHTVSRDDAASDRCRDILTAFSRSGIVNMGWIGSFVQDPLHFSGARRVESEPEFSHDLQNPGMGIALDGVEYLRAGKSLFQGFPPAPQAAFRIQVERVAFSGARGQRFVPVHVFFSCVRNFPSSGSSASRRGEACAGGRDFPVF